MTSDGWNPYGYVPPNEPNEGDRTFRCTTHPGESPFTWDEGCSACHYGDPPDGSEPRSRAMSDIVERLEVCAEPIPESHLAAVDRLLGAGAADDFVAIAQLCAEAAAEIRRLREQRDTAARALERLLHDYGHQARAGDMTANWSFARTALTKIKEADHDRG